MTFAALVSSLFSGWAGLLTRPFLGLALRVLTLRFSMQFRSPAELSGLPALKKGEATTPDGINQRFPRC